MDESDIYKSRPDLLARVFSLDDSSEAWSPAEMAQMLADLLAESVSAGGQSATLYALLESKQPEQSLLDEAKRLNKPRPGGEEDAIRQIQTVLYYAAIVAARVKLGARLTELPDPALLKGVRWALGQPWVDGVVREILGAGETALAAG